MTAELGISAASRRLRSTVDDYKEAFGVARAVECLHPLAWRNRWDQRRRGMRAWGAIAQLDRTHHRMKRARRFVALRDMAEHSSAVIQMAERRKMYENEKVFPTKRRLDGQTISLTEARLRVQLPGRPSAPQGLKCLLDVAVGCVDGPDNVRPNPSRWVPRETPRRRPQRHN